MYALRSLLLDLEKRTAARRDRSSTEGIKGQESVTGLTGGERARTERVGEQELWAEREGECML